ncbi:MAG: hypothetical protein WAT19_12420 [Ferruginibacter sp.]
MNSTVYLLRVFPFAIFVILSACHGQTKPATTKQQVVGGPCEGCELLGNAMPDTIGTQDFSPAWTEKGQKLLLTGTVYQRDGKTPARFVVIYYYHTNKEGRYLHIPSKKRSMVPNEKGQTHGYIRGWVKTDSSGRYYIYTIRPGTYPSRDEPAHIHLTLKEPGFENAYYIDDAVFDDDILLTGQKRKRMEYRCGSGVMRIVQKDGLQIGERNIILGLNIPGHPEAGTGNTNSGKNIGEDVLSFTPYHAWGPDKGTKTCPVCKYGWYHGILFFAGNNPNWTDIKKWLVFMETESIKRKQYLKAYFIYGNENGYSKTAREQELEKLGKDLDLKKTALTFVPSFTDAASEVNLNRVDASTESTIILYMRRNIIGTYINLKPSAENFQLITKRLDETVNEYYDLKGL